MVMLLLSGPMKTLIVSLSIAMSLHRGLIHTAAPSEEIRSQPVPIILNSYVFISLIQITPRAMSSSVNSIAGRQPYTFLTIILSLILSTLSLLVIKSLYITLNPSVSSPHGRKKQCVSSLPFILRVYFNILKFFVNYSGVMVLKTRAVRSQSEKKVRWVSRFNTVFY